MDMKLGHPLTGLFYVRGAEPGDILEVEVLELVPDEFGTTCIIPGFGLLGRRLSLIAGHGLDDREWNRSV